MSYSGNSDSAPQWCDASTQEAPLPASAESCPEEQTDPESYRTHPGSGAPQWCDAASQEAPSASAESRPDVQTEPESYRTHPGSGAPTWCDAASFETVSPTSQTITSNLSAEEFARYDVNGDGILDANEMSALKADIKAGSSRGKGGDPKGSKGGPTQ